MRILLTNDDGIDSEGIRQLADRLVGEHEVWLVAPEGEKSGASHSITLRDAIRVRCRGERRYACRGTTADCVIVSLLGLIEPKVDMVISGINLGPNLGTDILFSGTAAGARQGALMGVPSVAVSLGAYRPPFDFACGADFVARNLEIFRELWTDDHFLNINLPVGAGGHLDSVITFPSRRIYHDRMQTYRAPNGDTFCFVYGAAPDAHYEAGSDCQVLSEGKVSISPIHAHPRNWVSIEERYRGVKFT
ncbi:MAG TPA: 5'/3'-nucleotidase SurE [Spirochaetia bacterium]|nr:5'/3'-nucleotidase SurE [Spirochaetia bacterium]